MGACACVAQAKLAQLLRRLNSQHYAWPWVIRTVLAATVSDAHRPEPGPGLALTDVVVHTDRVGWRGVQQQQRAPNRQAFPPPTSESRSKHRSAGQPIGCARARPGRLALWQSRHARRRTSLALFVFVCLFVCLSSLRVALGRGDNARRIRRQGQRATGRLALPLPLLLPRSAARRFGVEAGRSAGGAGDARSGGKARRLRCRSFIRPRRRPCRS